MTGLTAEEVSEKAAGLQPGDKVYVEAKFVEIDREGDAVLHTRTDKHVDLDAVSDPALVHRALPGLKPAGDLTLGMEVYVKSTIDRSEPDKEGHVQVTSPSDPDHLQYVRPEDLFVVE